MSRYPNYHREEARLHAQAPDPYVTLCGAGRKRFAARTEQPKKVTCGNCRKLAAKYADKGSRT